MTKASSWFRGSAPSNANAPLLTVRVGDAEACRVARAEVPVETRPRVRLGSRDDALELVDSRAAITRFSLASLWDYGARYLHLSVRVGPSFACQADALLSVTDQDPLEAFARGEALGVRLQPFLLPECGDGGADFVGRGLFQRGLHYPGSVTPGNVSLLCLCDACSATFRLQPFHAGFSNCTYLYCSGGPHTLVASAYLEDAPPVLGKADAAAVRRFEARLPPCSECAGTFKYLNPLRCPACSAPYVDFGRHPGDREHEYYGNVLFGRSAQEWKG